MTDPILLIKMLLGNVLTLLPTYPSYLLIGILGAIFFGGIGLVFHSRRPLSPLQLSVSPLRGIVTYILMIHYLIPFVSHPNVFIMIVTMLFGIFSTMMIYRQRDALLASVQATHYKWWILGAGLLITLTLMLHNLTLQNGLHDEYYHHAVVSIFLQQNSWPIPDPYMSDVFVHEHYHHGWYFLVAAIASLSQISVEHALDLAKVIVLISCIIPTVAVVHSLTRSRSSILTSLYTFALYVSGPALLFLDSYTANVFFGGTFTQAFTPLLYELAGISWHGFTVISLLLMFTLTQVKSGDKRWMITLALLALSTPLLNRAMVPVVAVNLIGLTVLASLGSSYKLWIRHGIFTLLLGIVLMSGAVLTLMYGLNALPQEERFNAGEVEGYQGIMRNESDTGLILSTPEGIMTLHPSSQGFWQTAGVLWVVSSIASVFAWYKRPSWLPVIAVAHILLGVTLGMFLWYGSLGASLALNKYYRLILWWSIIAVAYVINTSQSRVLKSILLILMISGMVATSYYMLGSPIRDIQRYWDMPDVVPVSDGCAISTEIQYVSANTLSRPVYRCSN